MSVTHHTFSLDRSYDASPERVYAAWADASEKKRWWAGGDESLELDFRVGGREVSQGEVEDMRYRYEAVYQDIVPNERIIYTYEMHLDDKKISVSLATMEFEAEGTSCRFTLHEDGVFLDGWDQPEGRRAGTEALMDQLARHLAAA